MKTSIVLLMCVILCGMTGYVAQAGEAAAGWSPVADGSNTVTQSIDGRKIERFVHESRNAWGYAHPQKNGFYLVHPRSGAGKNAPLCVVLHSANRTAFDYLGYYFLNRKVAMTDIPGDVAPEIPADFYVLFLESNNDEWWGWGAALSDTGRYSKQPTPAECRVLDSVEWVATNYGIDRNRIHLTGVSMGGCGSLGIGLPHGEVFASVFVVVPAGISYAACRRGFAPEDLSAQATQDQKDSWLKQMCGVGLPDPPPVFDLSSQTDSWSKDQTRMINAAREGHLSLVMGWGPFGHTGRRSQIGKYPPCAAVLAAPWFEIRRNESYPVFTGASSDQRVPWLHRPGEFDETGQINAWFRWRNVGDAPSAFAMRLWIEPTLAGNLAQGAPKEARTDVTLRRLQQFRLQPGKQYEWSLVRGNQPVASGLIEPDAAGLLTIPRVTLAVEPAELRLKPR